MKSSKINDKTRQKLPPGRTPEAEENKLIALATDLARKQLQEGTASSQVIAHFLKLGSTKEKLEQESLRQEVELKKAKTELLKANQRMEELYAEAINAMRTYSGAENHD